MIRGRNEPCNTYIVAEIVAALKDISLEELSEQIWENSINLLSK